MALAPGQPFQFPDVIPGCDCGICTRFGVPPEVVDTVETSEAFQLYRLVKVEADNTTRELTDQEWTEFEFKSPKHCEWNMPPTQATWYKTCLKLVDHALRDKWAGPFSVPVDPILHGVPDYPKVVRHPIDLGTIKKKLKSGEYKQPQSFISDMRFVFRNAFVYNKESTEIWNMAKKLSSNFEQELNKLKGQGAMI